MSRALFARATSGKQEALCAGTHPAAAVHPEVIAVMNEIGIDLSQEVPNLLTQEMAERADIVVTMGCGDECPFIPGKRYIDWELPDPAGKPLDEVRAIRDEIAGRVEDLSRQFEEKPSW